MPWNTDSSDLYIDTYVTQDIISHKTYFLSGTFRNCAPQPYDGSSSLLMKIREKLGYLNLQTIMVNPQFLRY